MSQLSPYSVQRFRGGYALVWYEGDLRHRTKLDSTDRASAEAEARRLWQQAAGGAWTVGHIVNAYINALAVDNPPSLGRRRDAWKAMRTFWDNVDPALIDEHTCRRYREQRDVADATARYELLMLSTALTWAEKKLANQPANWRKPAIWMPRRGNYEIRYLEHDQFEKFVAEVKAPHARLYILLGLYTMARPSAILELTWAQVDFNRRQINLNPPGRQQTAKKRPVVAINDELYEALVLAYEARQGAAIIERGSGPIQSIKKAFQAASKRSGVKATPYTLRHTGAVWAAEGGVSMAELAQFMGHDDDRTTQKHYARFSPNYLKHIGEKVAKRRWAGDEPA